MNKKTFILGILALVVLGGIVWYASQNKEQINSQSSILSASQESSESTMTGEVKEELFLGNPDALVNVIEYSSHFCGHCINFHNDTLPLLIDKYVKTGKVKWIFRFLGPTELGLAIFCAQEENKFLEFNNLLFEHISEIKSVDDIKSMAGRAGLNQENFSQCFDSKKYEDKVEIWYDQATEAGVGGTPTFYINGKELVGNRPINIFEQMIEDALAQ